MSRNNEPEGWVIVLYILGGALGVVLLFSLVGILGCAVMVAADFAFLADMVAHHPWVGWSVAGFIIGAFVGFWTIAPIYGLRRYRPVILILPLLCIAIVGLINAL